MSSFECCGALLAEHGILELKQEAEKRSHQRSNVMDNQLQSRYKCPNSRKMAKLLIQSPGFNNQVINLNLGLNRFGRAAGNDFVIEHATVSSKHCEIALSDSEVIVRDCGSTNGTYINSQPISEARLKPGQVLRLGD